jgi:ABC-type transport system substrate-binding protein
VVKLFGGKVLAQPACQVLPPGFPGYEPYCPYTKNPGTKWSAPDLAKARELVKESGTAGQKVTIIVQDLTVDRSIGTYLQSVLKSIGYDASVKALSQNIQFTNQNKNKVQTASRNGTRISRLGFLNVLLAAGPSIPLGQLPEHRRLLRQDHQDKKERPALATDPAAPTRNGRSSTG